MCHGQRPAFINLSIHVYFILFYFRIDHSYATVYLQQPQKIYLERIDVNA